MLPAARAHIDAVNRRDLDGLVNACHAAGRIANLQYA
ncbi:hypothetical protein JOF29_002571 [Kribbella aluminosa]|uniref:Uncharacterized protein n=1 Tax=Kribbella aluminosa TaxID=416017 RepID=A0ABS4UIL0_9ACTN|nr:hypothetical protein [Kribbella aluminosa]